MTIKVIWFDLKWHQKCCFSYQHGCKMILYNRLLNNKLILSDLHLRLYNNINLKTILLVFALLLIKRRILVSVNDDRISSSDIIMLIIVDTCISESVDKWLFWILTMIDRRHRAERSYLHTRTHARTHARARTHTHTHTHTLKYSTAGSGIHTDTDRPLGLCYCRCSVRVALLFM